MPDFTCRNRTLEWLDQASPTHEERAAYFRSLARLNGAMLGHKPVLDWLGSVTSSLARGESVTLLDVGCGYGDLLRAIRRGAKRSSLPLRLIGVDIDPGTVAIARDETPAGDEIEYLIADVFNLRPSIRIDVVVSSLVAHHLDDDRLVALVRWMEATARRGWIIADLERHPVPYHAISIAGRLMRIHPRVIEDGRTSVTRALTRQDWRAIVEAAGIAPDAVRLRRFFYRLAVTRQRV